MNQLSVSRQLTIVMYMALVAFVMAHTINAMIAHAVYTPPRPRPSALETARPVPRIEDPQQSADAVLHSGLFQLPAPANGSPNASSAAPPPPPIEAGKKVTLSGTVHGKDGGFLAVLEDVATRRQNLYRVGSVVPAVGTLATVERNRVLFRDGVREEWLGLAVSEQIRASAPGYYPPPPASPVSAASAATAPQRRILDRLEVSEALSNPTRLLNQAQAVPYFTEGNLDGFRLDYVTPMGFFDKIGLRSQDILQRINGVELRDPGMVLSLLQQLRNERSVRLDVVRNSQRQTLSLEIR